MNTGPRSRGAALILALLIVSLVAGLAANMAGEHLLNIKYQRNYLDEEQAYFYLLAAEGLVRRAIFEDTVADHNFQKIFGTRPDSLCEDWLRPQSFKIDGGSISVRVEDMNRRFNLNLLAADQDKDHADFPYSVHQRRFIRLLQTFDGLDIDEIKATEIAEAVYDWLDRDEITEGFGGMEDSDYAAADFHYRTSNAGMASVSELRLIPAVTPALYRQLRHHVSVWPPLGRVGKKYNYSVINLNTITPNLMRALPSQRGLQPVEYEEIAPALGVQRKYLDDQNTRLQAAAAVDEKKYQVACGYKSSSEFSRFFPGGAPLEILGYESHQAVAFTEVRLGGITRRMETILHRVKLPGVLVQVWGRAFGSLL